MNNRYRMCATAATLAAIFTSCGEEELPQREIIRPVKLFTFGDAERQLQLEYPGRVYANRTVDVGFEVPGKLNQLNVVRGQAVKKGDLLAQLDQRDFVQARDAAQARVNETTATYGRLKEAAEQGAIAKQQVDEALARKQVAEADLKIRQKALNDSELRADFDGVVADRYVENFDNVVAKLAVLSLQDISKLEIRINIPEQDIAHAGKDPGTFTARFSSLPDRQFPLSIKEFATEADPVTQTFLATMLMEPPQGVDLLPGMTATVTWIPNRENLPPAPVVPATAVGGVPGEEAWVFVIDTETMTAKRRTVTVGQIVDNDMIEIRSGLQPGDAVAAAGIYHLEEGMKVSKYEPPASTGSQQ